MKNTVYQAPPLTTIYIIFICVISACAGQKRSPEEGRRELGAGSALPSGGKMRFADLEGRLNIFLITTCLPHPTEAPAGVPVRLPTWWGRCCLPFKCLWKYRQFVVVGSPPSRAFLGDQSFLAVIPYPAQDRWQPLVLITKGCPCLSLDSSPWWWGQVQPGENKRSLVGSGWGVWKPICGCAHRAMRHSPGRGEQSPAAGRGTKPGGLMGLAPARKQKVVCGQGKEQRPGVNRFFIFLSVQARDRDFCG